jgi:putative FmdB family regulatory protein
MPTYTYTCDACHREFEHEQRIIEPPLKKCPKCGKSKARRLISSGNFILKGGGWYSDGYGSSGGAAKSKRPSEPAKSAEPAATTSSASESKPAKSSDSASSD